MPSLKAACSSGAVAGSVAAQGRQRASVAPPADMGIGQIKVCQCGQLSLRRIGDDFRDLVLIHGKGAPARLDLQVLLRLELTVEAATGQAGLLHQVVDADAIEAALAEEAAGDLDHMLAVSLSLFPADAHLNLLGYLLRSDICQSTFKSNINVDQHLSDVRFRT